MIKYLRILAPVLLLLGMAGNALASLITGYATNGLNDNKIGSYSGDTILYYIPIASGSEKTYGVSGGGMTWDIVDLGTTGGPGINGAFLNMYLYFEIPNGEKGTSLTLRFTDLDLKPYNDPYQFYESLRFYGEVGLPNTTFYNYSAIDALLTATVTNNDSPTNNDISIDFTGLNINSGDFWLHLGFQATSDFTSGKWKNTQEMVRATITTVPEPGSLVLMAIGLLGLFWIRRLQLKPVRIKKRHQE